jgi:hypothetical protein
MPGDEILEMNKLLAHKFLVDSVHKHGPFETQGKKLFFCDKSQEFFHLRVTIRTCPLSLRETFYAAKRLDGPQRDTNNSPWRLNIGSFR